MHLAVSQITTVTFFQFHGKQQWWMFKQMGRGRHEMSQAEGLRFFKLMGSGADDGFSIKPDFSTYILLCVWEEEQKADQFFLHHFAFEAFKSRSARYWTTYLKNIKSHGRWSGEQPFESVEAADEHGLYVAVTRATIKPHRVLQFWRSVPAVSNDLKGRTGLIYSKGIGEFPIFMQATISFWRSKEEMVSYAYKSRLHVDVIAKTRRLGWYEEELFANFQPYRTFGNFRHPLTAYV